MENCEQDWTQPFCSPFFIPLIAEFYIKNDLKERYDVNFNVVKIEKYYSNQLGVGNGVEAEVQIENSKNIFEVHYGLLLGGIVMEYSHDTFDDFDLLP